jgi:hypothetical protein
MPLLLLIMLVKEEDETDGVGVSALGVIVAGHSSAVALYK